MNRDLTTESLSLSSIRISTLNTRKNLEAGTEDVSLEDLAQSIREHGLLNPILVYSTPDGHYELIAGQRRFLACQRLGWETIPAIVRTAPENPSNEGVAISLIENVQRADMHPLDKARAFQHLMDQLGGVAAVSRSTGVSDGTIRRYLDLTRLPEPLKETLSTREGNIGVEALSQLSRQFGDQDEDTILEVYDTIKGFRAGLQSEILKRSGGDAGTVEELVEKAQEGIFHTYTCHDGFCPMMDPPLRSLLDHLLAQDRELTLRHLRLALENQPPSLA